MKRTIDDLMSNFKVTKIVVTRSIKSPHGDIFVGWSGAYESVQEDQGGATDLITEEEVEPGFSLKETRALTRRISLDVHAQALRSAEVSGLITEQVRDQQIEQAKRRYVASLKKDPSSD